MKSLRLFAKNCFACMHSWTGISHLLSQERHENLPFIVCYHRVVADFRAGVASGAIPSSLIGSRMFEAQVDWLATRFSIASLDEIGTRLQSGQPFDRPTAAITFDDGYSDVYHHAYPILSRKGIPAACFVVTGLVDTGRTQIFDRLYSLLHLLRVSGLPLTSALEPVFQAQRANAGDIEQLRNLPENPLSVLTAVLNLFPQRQVESAMAVLESKFGLEQAMSADAGMAPLSWSMIESMHRGGMTIGSHTQSHVLLTTESLRTAQEELTRSRQIIEARLKAPIHHFAYPDGRFNPAVVQAAKEAGYRFAYTICDTRDADAPLLTIPRKVLWEQSCLNIFGGFSSAVMACQTSSAFDWAKSCAHNHFAPRETDEGASVPVLLSEMPKTAARS